MRKQITAGLILIIFTSLNLTANAAIKAGTTCKQLGLTSTSAGKKFTCIKSGKKLIWDKGTIIQATDNPASPKTSESPTNTVLIDYQRVSQNSYKLIREQWPTSNSQVTIQFHYTDNFPIYWLNKWKKQAELSINYFSKFIDKPEIFHVYFLTEKDQTFMESFGMWNQNNSPTFFQYWSKGQALNNCEGAASWYVKRKDDGSPSFNGGIAIASSTNTQDLFKECKIIISHESFHAVQDYFLTLKLGNTGFGSMDSYDEVEMPTFREGSAETISYALGQDSYTDYFDTFFERFHDLVKNSPEINKIKNIDDVVNYMKLIEKRTGSADAHNASYLMGMTFYEYLISKYGFSKYGDLLKSQNKNSKFREIFSSVYGVDIESAYKDSAQHILNALNVLRT